MVVFVEWDTDGVPSEELGLPEQVEIPDGIEEDEIADWLSDNYGYCVISCVD